MYQQHRVPVEGGVLAVGQWGNSGPVIFCSHGITANHQSFLDFAQQLHGEFRLIAPDHRGRGLSADISGPFSMEAHAHDICAVLDFLGIDKAAAHVGHSMGAYIGVVTKALFPDRLGEMILVDGGLPLADEMPQGFTTQQVIEAVIGPSMARLDMEFANVDAYFKFWRQHPAFLEGWTDELESYLKADLIGAPPHMRSGVNKEAILGDTESQIMSNTVALSLEKIKTPMHLLRAPRGIMNDAALYSEERVSIFEQRYPSLIITTLDDVNHYTIMLGSHGAGQVASYLRAVLKSSSKLAP
jgi:pimeloyl-ACP methyl ester carboxylesterase